MNPADPLQIWAVIAVVGLITLGIRLSFVLLLERLAVPEWFQRSLRFVPAAVLSALVVPGIVGGGSDLDLSFGNERLMAGIVAAGVAWSSQNTLLTLSAGMGTLWLTRALLG